MPRVVKVHEYAVKRNEIVDAALRMIYVKGFETMSIQDLLDDLKISKGAFYHYFNSKSDLLEAMIERIFSQVLTVVVAIVEDPALPAMVKLHRYFESVGRWKADRKESLLGILQAWYSNDNVILRQKMSERMIRHAGGWFATIVRQGIAEGVLSTRYPDHVGSMSMALILSLGDETARILLGADQGRGHAEEARVMIAALNDALERLLGAPTGSIATMSPELIDVWFGDSPGPPEHEGGEDSPSDAVGVGGSVGERQ